MSAAFAADQRRRREGERWRGDGGCNEDAEDEEHLLVDRMQLMVTLSEAMTE